MILLFLLFTIIFGRVITEKDLVTLRRVSIGTVINDYVYYTYSKWDNTTNIKTYSLRKALLTDVKSEGIKIFDKEGVSIANLVYSKTTNQLFFLSSESGSMQIWAMSIDDESNICQVTDYPVDIESFKIGKNEKTILFHVNIYPGMSMQESANKDIEIANQKYDAIIHDDLMVRRWDTYWNGKFNHLFFAKLSNDGTKTTVSNEVDLMFNGKYDCPARPFGGSEEYDISPNEDKIALSLLKENVAFSLNLEVYLIDVSEGSDPTDQSKWINVSEGNEGWDDLPLFNNDGTILAYQSMDEPKDESDTAVIMSYNIETKELVNITGNIDKSFSTMMWHPTENKIYSAFPERGHVRIASVIMDGPQTEVKFHTQDRTVEGFTFDSNGNLVFARSGYTEPTELYTIVNDVETQITETNKDIMSDVEFGEVKEVTYIGSNNDEIQAFVIYPPGSDSSDTTKTYPTILYVHGGPESPWENDWHYRWNPAVIAAQGYIVFAPNPHGSGSFGDKFEKLIRGNWGGYPYEDLMAGMEQLKTLIPQSEPDNTCAMGASYGGYMMNWLNGNTDIFKCIIGHDGVFDAEGNYYFMDELYFLETEYLYPQYEDNEYYDKWNPMNKVSNMKTPQLLFHGGRDYRLDDIEGYMQFLALQRQGVESKLVRYPEENHWVLNPYNSMNWHENVFEWLEKHLKNN